VLGSSVVGGGAALGVVGGAATVSVTVLVGVAVLPPHPTSAATAKEVQAIRLVRPVGRR
jgi:hypothetical protein